LSENAIALGDNSHCTDKLLEFSLETNRHFVFFPRKAFKTLVPRGWDWYFVQKMKEGQVDVGDFRKGNVFINLKNMKITSSLSFYRY
jgi:hypothetical protein